MIVVERGLAYAANLALGSAIIYAVHPEPLVSGWGLFIATVAIIGTCVARSLIETIVPRPSDEDLLYEWVRDVESPVRQEGSSWVQPFYPEKELNRDISWFKRQFIAAKEAEESARISPSLSILFIAVGAVVYVVSARDWIIFFSLACALLVGAIVHGTLSELGAKSSVVIVTFASISAGCYLAGHQRRAMLDLYLLHYDSIPFSEWLLSLGVVAPLIYIAILILAVVIGSYFEAEELSLDLQYGRVFAVKTLIEAIYEISRQMTWPLPERRSRVARYLRRAAYYVRYGLAVSSSSGSANLRRDQRRIYQGASRLLRQWADEISLPGSTTFESLRKEVPNFLKILMTEHDRDLPQLEIVDAPIGDSRKLHVRILRYIGVVLIAIIPGMCLTAARFAKLPLPDELGGAATLFSVAWATATLLLQFDTLFEKRLAATRKILTINRDKRSDQDDHTVGE